ncbi:hypothetical protein J3L18_05315 [Mucilaginibacter gossypii]|uniref:hypothetical protein n=1 Tax=Mucilaginibacter gossypii TaxID=551996 RepID=UPI000DCB4954|nr:MULTISPECIES: hypothetical protein [Mucilaginibacter]QTE38497.1 hypothetical protein J3L18_05315 [Mucilaginibacter gossypii]RAV55766.1 hypothetical protein DIU36_16880 [Mucilaginibacter rubeus]
MIKDSTIWKRFIAETPDFFKKVQIVCFILQLIINSLGTVVPINHFVATFNDIALGVILISQFAVKDIAIIQNSPDPLKAAVELIPELMEQKEAIIKSLKPMTDEYPETPVDKPQAA